MTFALISAYITKRNAELQAEFLDYWKYQFVILPEKSLDLPSPFHDTEEACVMERLFCVMERRRKKKKPFHDTGFFCVIEEEEEEG
jgi:hypothetical protein